jgi:CBS domain-containing protein
VCAVASRVVATLGELMTREVLEVAPEDTLGQAAEAMVERGVGSAVVSDFGRLIGILTERDLLRAVAGRVHSSEARVREWMTAEPVTASTSTELKEAAQTMLEQGFRHLPVVEDDRAIGIVSIRDVVEWTVGDGDGD